jgi:hypothetical protein
VDDAHHDAQRRPAHVRDIPDHPTRERSADEILDLIPREQIQALLAGAADRQHRPAVPDDLDALRARVEQLQAATDGTPTATVSEDEEGRSWDDAAELDVDNTEDQL